jgi:hypothetical protein
MPAVVELMAFREAILARSCTVEKLTRFVAIVWIALNLRIVRIYAANGALCPAATRKTPSSGRPPTLEAAVYLEFHRVESLLVRCPPNLPA